MAGTLRDRAQAVQNVKCAGTEAGLQNSGGGTARKAEQNRQPEPGQKKGGSRWTTPPFYSRMRQYIDIGAREIFVAVPADRDETRVRVFATFTADLASKQFPSGCLHLDCGADIAVRSRPPLQLVDGEIAL
jgi:hypothetical protein